MWCHISNVECKIILKNCKKKKTQIITFKADLNRILLMNKFIVLCFWIQWWIYYCLLVNTICFYE